MKLPRSFYVADVLLRGHMLNWLWRSSERRRQVRDRVIASSLPRYLKRYMPAAGAIVKMPIIKDDTNEKIFSFWDWNPLSDLSAACFRSVRRHCSQELVVLDEKSLANWVDLPGYIIDKHRSGKIGNAQCTDIIRVELLYNHGGFWLDATGFVTAPIPDCITNQDFFMYSAEKTGLPYVTILNSFIRSRKGSYLMAAWREMMYNYWKKEPGRIDYFVHQLLFKTLIENDPQARTLFDKMLHLDQAPTHRLWWDYADKPFDQDTFDRVTSGAFFQKTTYGAAKNPAPHSFADVMLKM